MDPGIYIIGPVHFLAGWHKSHVNQALVSLGLVLCMLVGSFH